MKINILKFAKVIRDCLNGVMDIIGMTIIPNGNVAMFEWTAVGVGMNCVRNELCYKRMSIPPKIRVMETIAEK